MSYRGKNSSHAGPIFTNHARFQIFGFLGNKGNRQLNISLNIFLFHKLAVPVERGEFIVYQAEKTSLFNVYAVERHCILKNVLCCIAKKAHTSKQKQTGQNYHPLFHPWFAMPWAVYGNP